MRSKFNLINGQQLYTKIRRFNRNARKCSKERSRARKMYLEAINSPRAAITRAVGRVYCAVINLEMCGEAYA